MALERIASATSYSALELVKAAASSSPALQTPERSAASPSNSATSGDLLRLITDAEAISERSQQFQAQPAALRSREDGLGQLLDARA
jgi:hypothetical protein